MTLALDQRRSARTSRLSRVCSGLAEDARGALLQLALLLPDLVGMNVELLGQLGQRFLTLQCGQDHFRLNAAVWLLRGRLALLLSSSQPS